MVMTKEKVYGVTTRLNNLARPTVAIQVEETIRVKMQLNVRFAIREAIQQAIATKTLSVTSAIREDTLQANVFRTLQITTLVITGTTVVSHLNVKYVARRAILQLTASTELMFLQIIPHTLLSFVKFVVSRVMVLWIAITEATMHTRELNHHQLSLQ